MLTFKPLSRLTTSTLVLSMCSKMLLTRSHNPEQASNTFGCHEQHELSRVRQKRKQHQIFLSKIHLALVTAAQPAMRYQSVHPARELLQPAAMCSHSQRVREGRSLFTAYSLPWKPWPVSRAWCVTLTAGGLSAAWVEEVCWRDGKGGWLSQSLGLQEIATEDGS